MSCVSMYGSSGIVEILLPGNMAVTFLIAWLKIGVILWAYSIHMHYSASELQWTPSLPKGKSYVIS